MAITAAVIEAKLVANTRDFDRGMSKASGTTSRFGGVLKKFGPMAAAGIGAAGVAAGIAGVKMIGLASDAGEVESKFKVVFGRTMPRLTRQIDAFSEATGASRFELREQVADLGALLSPIIKNTRETGKMSVSVAKLATDLSSFNNVPVEEALLAIRSGLVGEAEPLRRFGVLINEAAVKTEAYRSGIAKAGSELTESQKVQARYNIVMDQTKLAQGDAVRTSGSFANQLRRLKNNVTDAATEMGKVLLPAAQAVVSFINDHVMPALEGLGEFLSELFSDELTFKGKIKFAASGVRDLAVSLYDALKKVLLGGTNISKIEVGPGKFISFASNDPGLASEFAAALESIDWASVGMKIGGAIGDGIKFTASSLNQMISSFAEALDRNSGKIAEVSAKLALQIISTLFDPAFWVKNWQLVLGIMVMLFPVGRAVGMLGKVFGRLFAGSFNALATKMPGFLARLLVVLGVEIRRGFSKTFEWVMNRVPGWLKISFKLTTILAFVSGTRAVLSKLWDWIKKTLTDIGVFFKVKGHEWALAILEPFSHIPGKFGQWARDAKDRVNRSLDEIKIEQTMRKVDRFREHWEKVKSRNVRLSVTADLNVAGMSVTPGMVFGGRPGHHAPKNAMGNMIRARPGGVYMVAEGGYDEAVLSTDPRYKKRTYGLISEVIKRLEGRRAILPDRGFAAGGWTVPSAGRAAGRLDDRAIAIARLAAQFAARGMPAQVAYAEARRMEALRRPYLWGGGHGGFSSSGPWDCSGAVSQVLHKAGLLGGSPLVSGALMGWGRSGTGALTVFANPGHTFMSILGQGFGTSGENPGGGWGDLSYNSRSGFAARTYDRGGYLPPGLSLAYNGTGRPERVGGGPTYNFYGPVMDADKLRRVLLEADRRAGRRGGGF